MAHAPSRRATPPDTWILSNNPRLHSTQRLLQAARARDLVAAVVPPSGVAPALVDGRASMVAGGMSLPVPRVVLPRVGSSASRLGVHVVRQLELVGAHVVNPAAALKAARDKWSTAQHLVAGHVPVPPSVLLTARVDVDTALAAVGGAPVVLKLLRGSHGVGVMLCRTRAEVLEHVAALRVGGQDMLMQGFVSESAGRDIRALVVGRRVVAAMERVAVRGEFRANAHLGASLQVLELDAETRRVALRAASVMGLSVAGVDLMRTRAGPLVLEVNASPGLRGIESASGVDVAGAIMDHVARHAGRGQRS